MSINKVKNSSSLFTVVGGGISGLSTAYYLSKLLKASSNQSSQKITLIEGSDRFGGYIRSESHSLPDGTSVLYEKGPRTLRLGKSNEALATLDLIDDLKLHDKVLFTKKSAPSSKNRFIYYNNKINLAPSSPKQLMSLFSPVMRPVVYGVLKDIFSPKNSQPNQTDEPLSKFIARRFGSKVDDRLTSAVLAGIYASDTNDLSTRMIFNTAWKAEQLSGHVLFGLKKAVKQKKLKLNNIPLLKTIGDMEVDAHAKRMSSNHSFWENANSSSIFSFDDGLQTLSNSILSYLKSAGNVDIISKDPCDVKVLLSSGSEVQSSRVINTVPLYASRSFFGDDGQNLNIFNHTRYTSICLVNLTFKKESVAQVPGFGFLVPRDEWANIGIIGIVFDSSCLPGQDKGNDIVRFTVMMGGPTFKIQFSDPSSQKPENLKEMAIKAIKKALIIKDDPIHCDSNVLNNCIPIYHPNYYEDLSSLHKWLTSWNKSLSVAGACFGGPGINAIVLNTKYLAYNHMLSIDPSVLNSGSNSPEPLPSCTGLEHILALY
ncbi:hypothetical protein BB560_000819 [Smittium megazygosporum]|uniref:Protoporphyrinogen oxidase n=1 Tax=Smittium megazygosporum TaxID=133381 RepID=A0A2T9ZJC0_9FUNG|nr:hypothetical protein BB560_000819 [Smittium megazygosporum]